MNRSARVQPHNSSSFHDYCNDYKSRIVALKRQLRALKESNSKNTKTIQYLEDDIKDYESYLRADC